MKKRGRQGKTGEKSHIRRGSVIAMASLKTMTEYQMTDTPRKAVGMP
jgi:hypothetical protein